MSAPQTYADLIERVAAASGSSPELTRTIMTMVAKHALAPRPLTDVVTPGGHAAVLETINSLTERFQEKVTAAQSRAVEGMDR